ncbi:peptidoglycan-recognition protein LC isoform X1 [Drosophila sulfurigaster albostrigata]|uniref:peptidoglycan-recognition protein LC isoform X1 n=1 Tax=Drosophila sulfurigaster albostrigata TaxID=89887 RepID=UPI002D21DC88|nr:peptidoglycan-recognition protein LC isoform X1 [Drosophila sulfurigaster albostrigata]
MHFHNETELNTNDSNNIHIINRTSGKNCSTSSTDSGVGLVDNSATYRASPTITKSKKNEETKKTQESAETAAGEEKEEKAKPDAEAKPQRISIEVEAKVNLNKATTTRKTSPALSVRSTTISIVSIDEDAIDSSCIDSDSEAEADDGCTVHKLGQQVKFPSQSEELTQLNKGLTVISRQVVPNNGQGPHPPAAAADVVAQQVLNGNMNLATPTSPASPQQQIGSIALNNTTDVTFGDKHYYEGPVTIQQILIDSRDKWKTAEGHDNPAFNTQATPNATDSKLNNSCEAPALCPFLPHSISRKAIIITGILLGLTIIMGALLAVILGKTPLKSKLGDGEDTRQSIPINSPIDEVNIGGGLVLRYVPRAVWLAQPPQKELPSLSLPVPMVILLPTNSENCSTQAQCVFKVRFLQTFNIESERRDDISFNFLIGGDGNVYIGRGWDLVGAHLNGYNTRSVSFAYIGTFQHQAPSPKQLNVTRLLLEDGVNRGKIAPNYKLVGASTLEPTITQYNADRLYQSFSNWTHWTTVN